MSNALTERSSGGGDAGYDSSLGLPTTVPAGLRSKHQDNVQGPTDTGTGPLTPHPGAVSLGNGTGPDKAGIHGDGTAPILGTSDIVPELRYPEAAIPSHPYRSSVTGLK